MINPYESLSFLLPVGLLSLGHACSGDIAGIMWSLACFFLAFDQIEKRLRSNG